MQNNTLDIHSDQSTDLACYPDAKKLVDEIFHSSDVLSEPFLKILVWLKAHTPTNATQAQAAILCLTVAAYEYSGSYNEMAENYAASLWSGSDDSQQPDHHQLPTPAREPAASNLALTA